MYLTLAVNKCYKLVVGLFFLSKSWLTSTPLTEGLKIPPTITLHSKCYKKETATTHTNIRQGHHTMRIEKQKQNENPCYINCTFLSHEILAMRCLEFFFNWEVTVICQRILNQLYLELQMNILKKHITAGIQTPQLHIEYNVMTE